MKLYAIRDRLIDYFMQPFVGPDDKNVLASVARLVNTGEVTSDIAQAPHHFEVWSLAEITEDGRITERRQLLADCSSLVRTDIRTNSPGERGIPEAGAFETRSHNSPNGSAIYAGTHGGPLQSRTPTEPPKAPEAN